MRRPFRRFRWASAVLAVCLLGVAPAEAQTRPRRPARRAAPSSTDLADRLLKAEKTIRDLQQKIDDLQRQLKAEEARSALLASQLATARADLTKARAELARLKGGPPPSQDVKVVFVTIPKPELDNVGRIRKRETRLVEPVPGATHIVLVSGLPSDHSTAILFLTGPQSRTVTVSQKDARGGGRTLAYLTLKPEGLFWRWQSIAPSGRVDTHRRAEEALRPTMIELRSADRVVAKCQLAPTTRDVVVARPANAVWLPRGYANMHLADGDAPGAWTVRQTKDTEIRFTTGDFAFVVTLNPKTRYLAAQWEQTAGEQKADRLKTLVSELRRRQSENVALRQQVRDLRRERTSRTFNDYQIRSCEETIQRNEKRIAELQAEHKTLLAKSTAMPPLTGCRARVVLPNGVVLYAIKLTSL